MSLLPQRKKSPEEIAKLRESLGVPAPAEGEDQTLAGSYETIFPAHHEATVVHHSAPQEPETPAPTAHHEPKPVHSLKRSERTPEIPKPEAGLEEPSPVPHLPKPVRSLRKTEQVPTLSATSAEPSADSKIPFHRHNDKELEEIRRRAAIAMLNPVANPKLAAAHPALLAPGYLAAIAGASCFYFYQFPMAATAGCAATALLIATFVFLRRPISRHHAAFIAVIALFVIVFGALHYFPHLRHAT